MPINGGACTFFIFAVGDAPVLSAAPRPPHSSALAMVAMVGAIEGLLLHLNGWTLFYAAVFPMIIGAGNTVFRRAQSYES